MAAYVLLLAFAPCAFFWFAAIRYRVHAIPLSWYALPPGVLLYPQGLATRWLDVRTCECLRELWPAAIAQAFIAVVAWSIGNELREITPLVRVEAEVMAGIIAHLGVWCLLFIECLDTRIVLIRYRTPAPRIVR